MANISYGTATSLSTASNLNSLGSGSSTALGTIDNTSALALDYLVEVSAQSGASVSGTQTVDIFVIDSVDSTNFSDTNVNNMAKIGSIYFSAGSTTVRSKAFSVAQFFGGVMPPKVSVYAVNNTGATLAASGGAGQYRSATVA